MAFEQFLLTLRRLGGTPSLDERATEAVKDAAETLQTVPDVDRSSLARTIREHPSWVPILGLCVALSQEQLKNVLRYRLGSSGWRTLATTRAEELIELLDSEFGLVERISAERHRQWSFADILAERQASRSRAGGAIGRGRALEDEVERIVEGLGLPRTMRTRFVGRGGETSPCDLAIPGGGNQAQIVCAIKGFDSTGSKLSDAAGEIERMATVRQPRQFVYAVVDGIGWLSRQADLRRIYTLADRRPVFCLDTRRLQPGLVRGCPPSRPPLSLHHRSLVTPRPPFGQSKASV
jgi:hypothetical protein